MQSIRVVNKMMNQMMVVVGELRPAAKDWFDNPAPENAHRLKVEAEHLPGYTEDVKRAAIAAANAASEALEDSVSDRRRGVAMCVAEARRYLQGVADLQIESLGYDHHFTHKELRVYSEGRMVTFTLPLFNWSLRMLKWRIRRGFGYLNEDSLPPKNYGRDWEVEGAKDSFTD